MKGTSHIRKVTIRMFSALLTFLIGVSTSSVWFLTDSQPARPFRFLSGPPCREGLVSVESSVGPLRVTVSDTACTNRQSASVQFLVESLSTKPISKYEIGGVRTYDELVNGSSVTTEFVEPLQPRQTQIGFLGGGVFKGSGGKPVSDMKNFQLFVWSVNFADGTNWMRSSPN